MITGKKSEAFSGEDILLISLGRKISDPNIDEFEIGIKLLDSLNDMHGMIKDRAKLDSK